MIAQDVVEEAFEVASERVCRVFLFSNFPHFQPREARNERQRRTQFSKENVREKEFLSKFREFQLPLVTSVAFIIARPVPLTNKTKSRTKPR